MLDKIIKIEVLDTDKDKSFFNIRAFIKWGFTWQRDKSLKGMPLKEKELETIKKCIKEMLIEFVAKDIDKREDYTWVWQGAPLRMYMLPWLKEGKWIAVLTDKQAYELGKMAEVKKSLKSKH